MRVPLLIRLPLFTSAFTSWLTRAFDFNLLLSVWLSDETHLLVFDILHILHHLHSSPLHRFSKMFVLFYLQTVNAEVNSGNHKATLASNYATRMRGRYAALRHECTKSFA